MGVKLVSSSGGSVELAAPTTASNYTATMPANTGTVITTASTFAGTGPAFDARKSATQSVANNTFTKIIFDVEAFDTNSNYDTTTGLFTPTVAGYYQFNAAVGFSGQTSQSLAINFYKNGANTAYAALCSVNANGAQAFGSTLVYCNGSTDNVSVYAWQNSGGSVNVGNLAYFQGVLVRAA